MPKLNTIPSDWDIIPKLIGIKRNEPQIYLEYTITDKNQNVKNRRVRIPIRALNNRGNTLSAYEIAIQLSKQYSRYLEKISISQIERIVKLIQRKKVLSKEFLKVESKINRKESLKSFDFKNNKSFVLNDDDDNIYNFSTPSRSLISLNSLQPPTFLRENTSYSEPNLTHIPSLNNNKALFLNKNENDNQILDKLKDHDENNSKILNILDENELNEINSDTEKDYDKEEILGENDYSMNSFENDSILNSISKKDSSFKEETSKNKDLSNNYDQSFEQDFESIEEDFEEISVSEINTENDYVAEEPHENSNVIKREIPVPLTPSEDEDDDDEVEIEEIDDEKKEDIEKEEDYDDILISDISRNDANKKDTKNKNNNEEIEKNETIESVIEDVSFENSKIIDEDLNKVSEDELIAKKKEMDILFMKNQIKPGDPNYQYDVHKSFSMDGDADWDDSSESVSDKLDKSPEKSKQKDNDDSIIELVDRNTEIKKWNDLNINNKSTLTPTMKNQLFNKESDDENESISEEISLPSSENDSDFKVDPPRIINNLKIAGMTNDNDKTNEDSSEISDLSKTEKINKKVSIKEIDEDEIVSDSLDSSNDEDISIKEKSNLGWKNILPILFVSALYKLFIAPSILFSGILFWLLL